LSEANGTRSLVRKLSEVMAAVERIPKNGRNTFHNYDYATEADIVSAVRQELAKRHVMLLPTITSREREPVGEKGQVLTHLEMTFTFHDGESGETLVCPWLGAGTDKEDKGAYKAMTGGEKYFLLKTFLIPTGDDPEQDEGTEAPAVSATAAPHASASARPAVAAPIGLHVTNVKTAKKGTNDKGPWTLYIVKLSDGREVKTFSDSIAARCRELFTNRRDVVVTTDNDKLTGIEMVYQQPHDPDAPGDAREETRVSA
jgi:hypothetical protein